MTRLALYLLILAIAWPNHGIAKEPEKITIGILLPDNSHEHILAAAQLALDEANNSGGFEGQMFELVVRTAEGFWGAGSKESVNLVYEDQVRVIIGSLDGRNGHLAEQVATKSHLSYIETFATEPTLSQAFVPWFMRVVPNDDQQSAVIMDQIQENGGGAVGILSMDNYDTRYAIKSLLKEIERRSWKSPDIIALDRSGLQSDQIIDEIRSSKLEHLVIPFSSEGVEDLMASLGEVLPDLKVYGTLHFAMGVETSGRDWKSFEGLYILAPGIAPTGNSILKDSRSAYLYDAVGMVLHAIRQAGTDREAITEYLRTSGYSRGITGSITFDDLGNRMSIIPVKRIRDGVPILIK